MFNKPVVIKEKVVDVRRKLNKHLEDLKKAYQMAQKGGYVKGAFEPELKECKERLKSIERFKDTDTVQWILDSEAWTGYTKV